MEKGYFGLGSARNRSSPRLAKGAGGSSVWAGRASTRRGQGSWLLLRRQAHPLKTSGQVKDASGTRARRTTGNGPPVRSVFARQLGARGVPGVQSIGRRVGALGRRGRPREHAPAGPDAEVATACGAARPGSGAAHFRLTHFENVFLPKLEYKCTK
jgi:hypothetical protein